MTADATSIDYPSATGAECPWPAMARMRVDHPVYQLPDQPDMYVLSRWEDVRWASLHPELFTSDRSRSAINGSDVMIGTGSPKLVVTESEGADHKRKRTMAFQAVKPGRLKTYEPNIEAFAQELIDAFPDGQEFDFVEAFANPLPALVTCMMLGLPLEDHHYVRAWGSFEVPGLRWLGDAVKERQLVSAATMFDYLTEKILARHERREDDAISLVIDEQIRLDGEFDLAEVRAQVTVLLGGGVVTTAHFLSTLMYHALTTRGLLDRLRHDRSMLVPFLEEGIRIEGPSQWHPRRVLQDVELHGVTIPAGSFVLLMVGAANHDERRFPDAERFDIDRENLKHHMGFGYGAHFCLGAPLARLETRIAFDCLLDRSRAIRLSEDNDFTYIASPQFRGLRRLNLSFHRR